METKYLKTYNRIGINDINIDKIVEDWNEKWEISQWGVDEYTLIKYKNKRYYDLKTAISKKDALTLIELLNLSEEKSTIFSKGSQWKTFKGKKNNIIDNWLEEHGDPEIQEEVNLNLKIASNLYGMGITPSMLADDIGVNENVAVSILAGQYSFPKEVLKNIKNKYDL